MDALTFWTIAEAEPSRLALIDPFDREFSAGELLGRANRLVHALRARGLQPGDAVAAVLPNSVEAIELYLAVAQAGWYLVPINFHSVTPEIAYLLRDSEAKAFVVHQQFGEASSAAIAELGLPAEHCFAVGDIPGFTSYAELVQDQPARAPRDRLAGSMMNYTSGTTGRPKGVRRPLPEAPPETRDWSGALAAYGLEPAGGNVHLCCTPWYHTAPMVFVSAALHMGHAIVLMDRFDAEGLLALIERHGVTYTLMVPTQFVRLLALPEEVKAAYSRSSLRLAVHGAAPCPPEVKRKMIEWWGPVITEYYAATEGAGTIAFAMDWLRKPGTVGRPSAGSDVIILDERGEGVPPGEIGYVYLRPATGTFEYFKDGKKTADSWRGEYFTVNDMGYLDEDGYLFLADRKGEMIISGGVNIYPAEVESVLIAHPKVADAAVFGIPNDEWGEEVKAVIEPAAGIEHDAALEVELFDFCQGRLARFKIPKSIDFTLQMPRDPNGKLYRRKLRDPYWAGRDRTI